VLAVQRFANEHPHIYRLAMTRPTKPESAFAERVNDDETGAVWI